MLTFRLLRQVVPVLVSQQTEIGWRKLAGSTNLMTMIMHRGQASRRTRWRTLPAMKDPTDFAERAGAEMAAGPGRQVISLIGILATEGLTTAKLKVEK